MVTHMTDAEKAATNKARAQQALYENTLLHWVGEALKTYPTRRASITDAYTLILQGKVMVLETRHGLVRSSDGTKVYDCNSTCSCPYWHVHQQPCKHLLAYWIARRTQEQLGIAPLTVTHSHQRLDAEAATGALVALACNGAYTVCTDAAGQTHTVGWRSRGNGCHEVTAGR